ncbi:MAG: hypothetical protein JOZ30_07700 [Hyphomicrobiales bacterium]|nr:hypothetical protein [Hyphomicrobiales bacterium]
MWGNRELQSNKRRSGGMAMLSALLLGAASFMASTPAWAVFDGGGRGGSEHQNDWNADHDDIYQVQRGDLVCQSREACGGPAAIPMNRPGYWYLPGGIYTLHRYAPGPDAPYAAYHPRHYHHRHPLSH